MTNEIREVNRHVTVTNQSVWLYIIAVYLAWRRLRVSWWKHTISTQNGKRNFFPPWWKTGVCMVCHQTEALSKNREYGAAPVHQSPENQRELPSKERGAWKESWWAEIRFEGPAIWFHKNLLLKISQTLKHHFGCTQETFYRWRFVFQETRPLMQTLFFSDFQNKDGISMCLELEW